MHPTRHCSLLTACVLLGLALAPSVLAGTTSTLDNFLTPLNVVIGWFTGQLGRALSVLVLAGVAVYWWKGRAEGKGERAGHWLLGTAVLLGAPNIVDGLGFIGATY